MKFKFMLIDAHELSPIEHTAKEMGCDGTLVVGNIMRPEFNLDRLEIVTIEIHQYVVEVVLRQL